jgi:hypothetical protein
MALEAHGRPRAIKQGRGAVHRGIDATAPIPRDPPSRPSRPLPAAAGEACCEA